MKPIRMKLAHHLLLSYGLYRQLEVYVSIDSCVCFTYAPKEGTMYRTGLISTML